MNEDIQLGQRVKHNDVQYQTNELLFPCKIHVKQPVNHTPRPVSLCKVITAYTSVTLPLQAILNQSDSFRSEPEPYSTHCVEAVLYISDIPLA